MSFTGMISRCGSAAGSGDSFVNSHFHGNDELSMCLSNLTHFAELRKDMARSTHGANAPVLIDVIKLKIASLEHFAKKRPQGVEEEEMGELIDLSRSLAESHDASGGIPYKDTKALDQFIADSIRVLCLPHDGESPELNVFSMGSLRADMGDSCPLAAKEMDKAIMKALVTGQKIERAELEV